MFRQISFGAAAVLTAGMVAVGCGSDGDTIIGGSSGDIFNNDQTGFTTIGSNNLTPDGGGLSPDGTDASDFRVIYNENNGSSDGSSTADCSAVILFTTTDNRTFVTHYNGSITPPVELQATDHGNSAFDIQSACVSFLNTSGYENSGASADVVNAVRQNNGMILLVMSGRTAASSTSASLNNVGSTFGVHTALWSWLFNPAFRGTEQLFATTTANLVGSIPATATTSRYYNSPTNEFRFGWQRNAGAEIARNSGTATPVVTGAIGTQTPGTSGVSPADTLSYGLVTDGNQREQVYNGAAVVGGSTPGRVFGNNTAISTTNDITPGEAVNVLALVYTQIVTSKDLGTGFDADAGAGAGSFGGSTTALFNSSFNLATLSFETVGRINPTGTTRFHNVNYQSTFRSYNNLAVVVYEEGSPSQLANTDNYATGQTVEKVVQKIAFRQSTTGGATAATPQDLSVRPASLGVHTEFNSDSSTFQTVETGSLLGSSATMIYGRDEGLLDTVIFFAATDGSSSNGQDDSGTAGGNTDRALYAALLTQQDYTVANTTDGDLVTATNNPLLISSHNQVDVIANTLGNSDEYTDDVAAESTLINRNGEYILVGYTQNEGTRAATSLNITRRRTLKMVAYQTNRSGTNPAFNTRFSTPTEISNPAAYSGSGVSSVALNNGNVANNETHLPVNFWEFEGSIDYRCGFQSNTNVVWALWEQSDGSEDRLFVRPVTVVNTTTPPTISTTTITTEIEEATSERVPTTAFGTNPSSATLDRNDVAFLNTGLGTGTAPAFGISNVESCDLGTAGAQTGATTGGLFLAYVKTTDDTKPAVIGTGTSGDSDGIDRGVFANGVLLAGTELGRVVVDNNFNEDDYSTGLSTGNTIFKLVPVGQANVQLGSTTQPNLTYVLFNEAEQAADDGTSDALYLRTFDNTLFRGGSSTGAATDFNASFVPATGTGGTVPLRLDHLTGGDVDALVGTATAGNRLAVIFTEDDHDWLQATSDGRSVFTQGGSPNPLLMDQDRSSDVSGSKVVVCTDDNCDAADVIYLTKKGDVSFDTRLVVRTRRGAP